MGSAPAAAPSRTAPSPQPYERKKTSPTTSASPTPAKVLFKQHHITYVCVLREMPCVVL
jgi:hypothetical protein